MIKKAKFTNAEAKYAMSRINWNTEATERAKQWMRNGFTRAQASYGVRNCGKRLK